MRFGRCLSGEKRLIDAHAERREIALLRILVACGDKTIEALQASHNPVDADLLADLERVIARSRDELAALTKHFAGPS